MSDYIKRKEYKLPDGSTVTAYFDELGCAKITIQAMDALFDILNSSAQQWIPCSERLPKTNVSILYCTTTGTVGEGRYEGYNGIHEVWKMYAICGTHWDDEVVAWMPLPELYKGEES